MKSVNFTTRDFIKAVYFITTFLPKKQTQKVTTFKLNVNVIFHILLMFKPCVRIETHLFIYIPSMHIFPWFSFNLSFVFFVFFQDFRRGGVTDGKIRFNLLHKFAMVGRPRNYMHTAHPNNHSMDKIQNIKNRAWLKDSEPSISENKKINLPSFSIKLVYFHKPLKPMHHHRQSIS